MERGVFFSEIGSLWSNQYLCPGKGGGADNFLGGTHDFQGKWEGDESVQTEYNEKTTEN